jgi:hypothetical protein
VWESDGEHIADIVEFHARTSNYQVGRLGRSVRLAMMPGARAFRTRHGANRYRHGACQQSTNVRLHDRRSIHAPSAPEISSPSAISGRTLTQSMTGHVIMLIRVLLGEPLSPA